MFEYACDPEMAQNSNPLVFRDHMFFFLRSIFQVQNELSEDFRAEKSEPSQEKTCDHEKLKGSSFEPSRDHMHIQTCDNGSFDDFFAISGYILYAISGYPTATG